MRVINDAGRSIGIQAAVQRQQVGGIEHIGALRSAFRNGGVNAGILGVGRRPDGVNGVPAGRARQPAAAFGGEGRPGRPVHRFQDFGRDADRFRQIGH